MEHSLHYVKDWLLHINKDDIIPPFCVEIVFMDNTRYYLHSMFDFDKQTETAILRIWDLRALDQNDIEDLKHNLNKIHSRSELKSLEKVHPKID